MASAILEFEKLNIDISIDELVEEFAVYYDADDSQRFLRQYKKLRSLARLYEEAIIAGWETFSWKRAADEGWLSRYHEKTFASLIADENRK